MLVCMIIYTYITSVSLHASKRSMLCFYIMQHVIVTATSLLLMYKQPLHINMLTYLGAVMHICSDTSLHAACKGNTFILPTQGPLLLCEGAQVP